MDIQKRRLKGYVALSVLIIACLIMASAMSFFTPNNSADALVDTAVPTRVGNGVDMWNSQEGVFNSTVFEDLIQKLFGDNADWQAYVKTMTDEQTQSYVIPASTINSKAGNVNDGLVLTLGGYEWMITSLTLTNDSNEDVVLTLYRTKSEKTEIYAGSSDKNMYSSSTLRKTLLESQDFKMFSNGESGGFANQYLVQPKNIKYQLNQSMIGRGTTINYNFPNDALGDLSEGWHPSAKYQPDDEIGGIRYDAWGDDYIWIPSGTETGYSNLAETSSIWGLSNNQRGETKYNSWMRSGCYYQYWAAYLMMPNAGYYDYALYNLQGIRPAIHLNLSVAKTGAVAKLPKPTDINDVVYNGEMWDSLTKIPSEKKTWFDDSKMTVTFPSNVKDAGTYQVRVAITNDDDVFAGEPDPQKGNGDESDRVRYFNFTIVKKKIGVTISPDGKSVESDDICEKDVGTERAPTFGLTYKGIKDTSYNTPEVYPTAVGNYRATAKLLTNGNNYELTGTITKDFEIKAKDVDKPTITGLTALPYNGEEREFTINASADVIITAPEGMRYESGKLYAKNVGTYKIKMSLVDDGVAKQWTDLKNSKDREDITLEITKATLTITFNGDTWSWNSKTEQTVTFSDNRFDNDNLSFNVYYDTTPINNVSTDHNTKTTTVTIPQLDAKAYSLKVSIKESNDDDSKNYKITNDVAQRSFTVSDKEIEVKESNIVWKYSINNSGANEVGTWTEGTPYSALTYDKDKTYYFFAELTGIDAGDGVTATWETKKSGSVVEYGKDADTYTTTVTLSSDKVKFKNNKNTFTLTWTINKAKFDLSNVKWNYTKPLPFNDKMQTVTMTGIPDGLTFNYRTGSNEKRAVGTYTAEVLTITVRNDIKSNYVTPEVNKTNTYVGEVKWTLPWEIKKGELELEWVPKEEKDVNDKLYSSWESTTYTDKIEYRYYTLEAYADGALTGAPIDKRDIIVPDEEAEIEYYIVAVVKDSSNYEIVGTWAMPFVVGSMATVINISMASEYTYDTNKHGNEWYNASIAGMEYVSAEYFKVEEDGSETSLGATAPTDVGNYIVRLSVDREYITSYQLSKAKVAYTITKAQIEIAISKSEYGYDGSGHAGEFTITSGRYDISKIVETYYKGNTKDFPLSAGELPCDAGDYLVVLSLPSEDNGNYEIKEDCKEFTINVATKRIVVEWNTTGDTPIISGLDELSKGVVGYVYYNEDGTPLEDGAQLERGKSYKIKAILTGDNAKNFEFVTKDGEPTPSGSTETAEIEFTVKASNSGGNVGGVTGGDGEGNNNGDGQDTNEPHTNSDDNFSDIGETLKKWWQVIVSALSIVLIVAFMAKGLDYASKRKKIKKTISKKYSVSYYAVGGLGLFGLPYATWTIIAGIMAGVAALAFIFMLLEKRMLSKAEEELDEAKDEFEKNQKELENKRRDEQMQMMLMGMMGGNANGGQGFAFQQGVSADEMRLMINDAMSNMLPSVTQYLPQQASGNDELVQQLVEQNAHNEERIRQLTQQNEERIKELAKQNEQMMEKLMDKMSEAPKETVNEDVIEKLVEKLAKQQVAEREAEKEVASAVVDEKTIEELKETIRQELQSLKEVTTVKTVEKDNKDEKIEMLMRNQEMLMKQIVELTANRNNDKQVVVPIMPQPTEKVVEKIVQIPVEKIVEKEVKVEVPVEKIVEVEKVGPMPVEKPAPKTKTTAQRLTLDEAYAKLSDKQKKIFDTLKNYALSKDKCKEKKSTYFTVLGQSTVNPLVKLTIKKNTTVAMFKMEDEYFKDIRRNAGSDGTKVKVKESEIIVSDNQALSTAKEMIDLREDQIERYNEYLREQRSMKRK